jgi:hypothetical protein
MKHPSNRLLTLVITVAFLMCTGVFSFFWMPEAVSHGNITGRIKKAEEGILKIKSDNQAALIYAGLSAEADSMEKKASSDAGEGDILMKINSAARQSGIKLSVENAAREKEPPAGYEGGTQSLVITGNYSGLRRFIYNIENMDVLTVLRKVRIERTGRTPGNIKAWVELAYYRKLAKAGVK